MYDLSTNKNADIDVKSLSPEKLQLYSKIIEVSTRLGYALLEAGQTDFAQWRDAWLDKYGDRFAAAGFSNRNIREVVESIWQDDYEANNRVLPMKVWAEVIRYAEALRAHIIMDLLDLAIDANTLTIVLKTVKEAKA